MMNSKIYKYPTEILDTRKLDYIDGDAHLFVEMKMIFFFFIFVKVNFRFLHRVGPPFGKGICLNTKHIIILFCEFLLAVLFIGFLFLDNITSNKKILRFSVEYIGMPDYTLK